MLMTDKRITYALDTSVLLTNANCIYSFGSKSDIVLPIKVLEEIDKHKKRQDSVGMNARLAIKSLDELREKGDLREGVEIAEGKGNLIVIYDTGELALPRELSREIADHQILQTVYNYARKINILDDIVVVSRDINMRVICQCIGMKSADFDTEKVVSSEEDVYYGFSEILMDDELIDRFYSGDDVYLDKEQHPNHKCNEFIMLISNSSEKKTALSRFTDYETPLRKIVKRDSVWGLQPRNKEQSFAFDLLMDKNIKVVSLIGRAGSGKTLCALAAGLQQTLSNDTDAYSRLIISRPVQPLGKDIGFLPGTLEEKMIPWLSPIQDNLQFLMGNDKEMFQEYMDKGIIEVEALTFIRGRSIANAYIIIDEAQNLTRHEIKTIITRVGDNTKIILTGDVEQIDNVYINETSNGLVHAVEKFKEYQISGHITLKKGERSEVASLAAKVL
jgi:PhoH-like ATPase